MNPFYSGKSSVAGRRPLGDRKRTRRSRLYAAALVGVSASCIGLLSVSANASGAAGLSGTLTIQSLNFIGPQTTAVVNGFEKQYPNVHVVVSTLTNQQFDTNLVVLTSKNPPDVGWVDINRTLYPQLVKAHQLVPLTSVWSAENLQKRYGPSYTNAVMQGQKVPYVVFIDTVYYNTIIYNQGLFAKLGIPDPSNHRFSSLAELTSAIAKLKAAGYAGIAFGADNTYACADLISGLLPTSASLSQLTNYLSNFNSTVPVTARYTDAAFLNVLRTIQGYNAKGFFQNGFLGMSDAQAQNVFLLGKAGMELPDSTLPSTPSFKTNWALLPPVNPGRTSQIDTFSDSIGIPANAKHIALAEKFLEYYVSKQGQEAVAAAHSDLAVVNDVPLSAYGTGLPSTGALNDHRRQDEWAPTWMDVHCARPDLGRRRQPTSPGNVPWEGDPAPNRPKHASSALAVPEELVASRRRVGTV